MEKTELMKEYESRTGLRSTRVVGDHWCNEDAHTESYVDDLEERFTQAQAKAEAYDSLVSKTVMSDAELDAPLAQRILREMAEKAEAYDRLMFGGKKTPKEWANFIGKPIAMNENGEWYWYSVNVHQGCNIWYPNNSRSPSGMLPFYLIDFSDDWTTSLTFPDNWEAPNAK